MSRPLRILLAALKRWCGSMHAIFRHSFPQRYKFWSVRKRAKRHGKPSGVFQCCEPEVLGRIFLVRSPVRFSAIFGSMPNKRMW